MIQWSGLHLYLVVIVAANTKYSVNNLLPPVFLSDAGRENRQQKTAREISPHDMNSRRYACPIYENEPASILPGPVAAATLPLLSGMALIPSRGGL